MPLQHLNYLSFAPLTITFYPTFTSVFFGYRATVWNTSGGSKSWQGTWKLHILKKVSNVYLFWRYWWHNLRKWTPIAWRWNSFSVTSAISNCSSIAKENTAEGPVKSYCHRDKWCIIQVLKPIRTQLTKKRQFCLTEPPGMKWSVVPSNKRWPAKKSEGFWAIK